MRHLLNTVIAAVALAGCAHERIVSKSGSYYKDLSRLAQQEVIDNIDETIINPYRIPSRTTFGKGNLTSTDNGNASLAVPLHATSSNSGVATANVGSISDSYQIALVPEVDGVALGTLREVYRAAVYPESFKISAGVLGKIIGKKGRWLYWRKVDGSIQPGEEPPLASTPVGKGQNYEIWVTDLEAFAQFVLLTYGQTPANERVTPTVNFVLPPVALKKAATSKASQETQQTKSDTKPSTQSIEAPRPPLRSNPVPNLNVPPRIKPQFQFQLEEQTLRNLGGKAAPGPNEPALPAQIR
jgi:hypothetical protein